MPHGKPKNVSVMTVTPELNNRPNKDGLHSIQIRITHNRKLKRIALEYAILMRPMKVLEAQQEALLFPELDDDLNGI